MVRCMCSYEHIFTINLATEIAYFYKTHIMLNEYVSAIQGRRASEMLVQNPRPADYLGKYKTKQNPKNKDFILRICF